MRDRGWVGRRQQAGAGGVPPRSPLLRAAVAVVLVALCAAVYGQVRHHEFVDYDDYIWIVAEPKLRPESWRDALGKALEPEHGNFVPITMLSFQLSYRLHGTEPAGYLLTNVGLHAASSVVLFLALASLTGATGRSAFVAAVFAVHPLHVESVAWATERKDVLSGLFWMLALAAWGAYARRASALRYGLVLLCLVLGLGSKPMVVTLPFVLLLLDYWPLGRLSGRAVLEKLPMLVPVAGVAWITLVQQREAAAFSLGDALSWTQRLANAVDSYAVYVAASFWPTGLAVFYPHPEGSLPALRVALAAAFLLAVTGAAVALRRSRPYLLVGWLWYLGTLVPVIGIVQVGLQARADRYTYLPQVGLALAVAWGVHDLARGARAQRALGGLAAVSVAALAVAAWGQVGTWRDSFALFERALAVAPESHVAHTRLGTLHLREGRPERAEHHFRRAFEIDPERGRARWRRFQLGMAQLERRRGNREAALAHTAEAVRIDPDDPRARRLHGLALVAAGRGDEARPHLEAALGEEPPHAEVRIALARLAWAEGRAAEAAGHYRAALEIDPERRSARNDLAWILATSPDPELRDPDEAVALAEALLADRPVGPNLLDTAAAAFAAAGRFGEAVATAEQGLEQARAEQPALAAEIAARLEAYRTGRPWVEGGAPADPGAARR